MQLQVFARAPARQPYPSDVSDEEWAFVAPYLAMVRAGAPWRMIPNHFPPWAAVYQQTQRWIAAGVFEAMVHDLRAVLRLADVDAKDGAGQAPHPSAVILDGPVLQ